MDNVTQSLYLSIDILRMKEQLIRQLVKNEKDSAVLVRQHKEKITQLEEVSI